MGSFTQDLFLFPILKSLFTHLTFMKMGLIYSFSLAQEIEYTREKVISSFCLVPDLNSYHLFLKGESK